MILFGKQVIFEWIFAAQLAFWGNELSSGERICVSFSPTPVCTTRDVLSYTHTHATIDELTTVIFNEKDLNRVLHLRPVYSSNKSLDAS